MQRQLRQQRPHFFTRRISLFRWFNQAIDSFLIHRPLRLSDLLGFLCTPNVHSALDQLLPCQFLGLRVHDGIF
jgi:hypothetical protein